MFAQSNGILYKDGQPVIALGNSYYPSFHEAKFPVPPEGDRMGEMRKDLKHMAEYGFNLVRFAALGEVALNPDTDAVEVSTPLIDAMIQEAGRSGMASSIRLQGYVMNLRGHADYLMRMLARVEGMPLESLQQGVPWNWTTSAEYFDQLDGTLMPNIGFLVGHVDHMAAVGANLRVPDPIHVAAGHERRVKPGHRAAPDGHAEKLIDIVYILVGQIDHALAVGADIEGAGKADVAAGDQGAVDLDRRGAAVDRDGVQLADVIGIPVSYTHLRAHETVLDLVCRLLLEKKNNT